MAEEALVIGGGLAGGAAALLLARAGRPVRLLERERGPHHKVCGEFLSVEAHRHLSALGLDPRALGAVPIERVRLVSGGRVVEAPLPFAALGLSRLRLDEALLDRAAAAGAAVERGVRVLSIEEGVVRTSAGERGGGPLLLATGKLPLRGQEVDRAVGADPLVGFKMHYRLHAAARARLAGVILLILFDGGYAGMQLVEDGRANLCLVINRSRLAGGWPAVTAMLAGLPHCGDLLADAEPLFDRPVSIANLPYGRLHSPRAGETLYRLGDQAAMTASLTGDGMAIALRGADMAARCIAEEGDAEAFHRRHRAHVRRQLGRAMLLQRAVGNSVLRKAAMVALGMAPSLLGHMARATRLPET